MYGYPGAPAPAPMPAFDPRAYRMAPTSPLLQQWQNPQLAGAPVGYQGVPVGYGSPLAPGSSNAFGPPLQPAFDATGYNFAGIADPNRAIKHVGGDRAIKHVGSNSFAPEYGYY